MDNYTLNDGREPLRFDRGRAAFYRKVHGQGEVRYTFSMIKHFQQNRPRLSHEERSALAKSIAQKKLEKDPKWFANIGTAGGLVTKKERKDRERNRRHELSHNGNARQRKGPAK